MKFFKTHSITFPLLFASMGFLSYATPSSDDKPHDGSAYAPPDVTAVDLGLSVKWADRNVGADTPEGIGGYFGYGDVTGEVYSTSYADYTSQDVGGTEHDPAYRAFGAGWRMPRASEIKELVDRCTWTWTRQNGVNGFIVKGRGSASIFLPATGFRSDTVTYFVDKRGYYWSGEVNTYNPNYVGTLFFYKDNHSLKDYRKIYGFAVRPVHE